MSSEKSPKSFLIDAKAVKTLARVLHETDLSEIEYELDSGRIRVVRERNVGPVVHSTPIVQAPSSVSFSQPVVEAASVSSESKETDWTHHVGALKSPLVGTAYLLPQPDAAPFVKEGDDVQEGQTLLILEAMKVMNPIRAPKSGKILKILALNGQPVEYGETLMVIG